MESGLDHGLQVAEDEVKTRLTLQQLPPSVNAKPKYQRLPTEVIIETYQRTRSVWRAADELGISAQTVSARLKRAGISAFQKPMEDSERRTIREYYATATDAEFDLSVLAKKLGRTKHLICRRAREMGLTRLGRPRKPEVAAATGEKVRQRIQTHGHPRGYLGRKHRPETRVKLSVCSQRHWDTITDEQKAALVLRQLKTKVKKYGCVAPNVRRGSWKASWREIGGQRKFFRSRWEANYARYLQWLKERGEIAEWQHEPETFWFEAIKRGVRSYLPDFKVTESGGAVAYHEVKGWFDARSKTTIRRMAKYYPHVTLVVIDNKQYAAISKAVGSMIEGWE